MDECEQQITGVRGWSREQLASVCDHTFLKRAEGFAGVDAMNTNAVAARNAAFSEFLDTTIQGTLKPYALCVRPEDVEVAFRRLKSSGLDVKLCAVAGFPDGATPTPFKVSEAEIAVAMGAVEVDIVLNISIWRSGGDTASDIGAVVTAAGKGGALVKLILEVSELSLEEVGEVSQQANGWGVDFIKTSTGFSGDGATIDAVEVMARNFSGGIKISGGVTVDNVYDLLAAVEAGRGASLQCDPRVVRIGESGLLTRLQRNS